jgi:CHASE3 domain sensor protein
MDRTTARCCRVFFPPVNLPSAVRRSLRHVRSRLKGPRVQALAAAWARRHQRVRTWLAPVEPRWLVALSMALIVLGGSLLGGVARRGQAQLLASSQQVTRVMELEQLGRALVAHLEDAEQSARAFVTSSESADAEAYRAALALVPDDLQRLRSATRSNPNQQPHLGQLETLVNQSREFFNRILVACELGDHESAFALLLSGNVARGMDAIRSCTVLLALEEQRSLALRQQHLSREAAANRAWLVFVALVTAAFVAGVLFVASRLARLRRLARVCAWSRTIEFQGEWLKLEDYLERRFHMQTTHGISPAEAAKMRAEMPPT